MKLSVIIVNYNVEYFLEQCLNSVKNAINNIDTEVFVIDNNSVDGSCNMVREKFPFVKLIENKTNTGFSVANNQAIKIAVGEYILLLNPDTLVEEDTFVKVCDFMDNNLDAGGLGVKMIDGKGNFLPESKRGLPSPEVAFYKLSGLSKLFPKSKKINRYHLGYLDKNKTHEIEVLSGAFMLMRKKVLDKVGMLDETFFMYGEDIDLSYRITKGGYKNYYYPETTIIHYKGESTKKGSINYVIVFYKAMIIFAQKHFSNKNAKLFSLLINIAIYFKALLELSSRFIKNAFLPAIDSILIYSGFTIIKPLWETYKFHEQGVFPDLFFAFLVPSYIFIWITSLFFIGAYDKPIRIARIAKGTIIGSLIILIFYSLLGEDLRVSRAIILLGAASTFISLIASRYLLHFTGIKNFQIKKLKKKNIVIIGGLKETKRIDNIIKSSEITSEIVGYINPENKKKKGFIGGINQLNEIIRIYKINEVIYCAKDISSQAIIQSILNTAGVIDYKIASPDSLSIVGSSSLNTQGDLYVINLNSIAKDSNQRNKRLIDIIAAVIFLFLIPFFVLIVKKPFSFIKNILMVIVGSYSWVGYCTNSQVNYNILPKIKKGILPPLLIKNINKFNERKLEKMNMIYAKDYRIINDINLIARNIKYLGR